MFVNVRKMVSIFESKKQPRPLSLPPCEQTQRESEKQSLTSEPRLSLLGSAPSAVTHRPRPLARERARDAGGVQGIRDSWPTGKIDYYPRANRVAVSIETSKHSPPRLKTSSVPKPERVCSSKPSHIASPAGQISEKHPDSSCVSDQKRQNHVWSSLKVERGGANTHTRKPRPSDSTLLSLLLLFHR